MRSALAALLLVTACEGAIVTPVPGPHSLEPGVPGTTEPGTPGQPPPPPVSACKPGEVLPGPAPIRRMTRFEYDNTVRDLLGDDTHPASTFGAEEEALGFNNNAQALTTSSALVDQQLAAAEAIAVRVTTNLARLSWFACAPTASDRTCAEAFVDAFAPRAWRRPAVATERTALLALYDRGAATALPGVTTHVAGLRSVIEGVLLSPDFLYRVEPVTAGGGAHAPLEAHVLAARLSYLLWASLPDEALREAASTGKLSMPEELDAQVRRMLADPRARAVVGELHEQWLDYGRIANVGKASQVFPDWSAAIGGSMRAETHAFVEHVVFEGEGTLEALLTAPYSFVDGPLAGFYGLSGVPANAPRAKLALDPAQRGGLLTQGSLLALNAHSDQTSPVHRGKLVREAFFCQTLPAPPADVMITVPEPLAGTSARERFREHSANAACSACHTLMDPIGFGFEAFDGQGRHRETENGAPVDVRGEIIGTDVAGAFAGVPELSKRLARSAQVRRCYVKQWFRFGLGRGEQPEDACTLERLEAAFSQSGGKVQALIQALTTTDAFLYQRGAP